MKDIILPAVIEQTTPALTALTKTLGIPREVLASDGEIETAWGNLTRVIRKIPPHLRNAPACFHTSCVSDLREYTVF